MSVGIQESRGFLEYTSGMCNVTLRSVKVLFSSMWKNSKCFQKQCLAFFMIREMDFNSTLTNSVQRQNEYVPRIEWARHTHLRGCVILLEIRMRKERIDDGNQCHLGCASLSISTGCRGYELSANLVHKNDLLWPTDGRVSTVFSPGKPNTNWYGLQTTIGPPAAAPYLTHFKKNKPF